MEKEKQKQILKNDLTEKSQSANYKFYSTTELQLVIYNHGVTTNYISSINYNKKLKQKETEAEPCSVDWKSVLLNPDLCPDITVNDAVAVAVKCHRSVLGSSVSFKSKKTREAIEEMLDEGRTLVQIIQAIHGIKKDPWEDRPRFWSFTHIAKHFDKWVALFSEPDNPSAPGGYGPWRDEGYATEADWIAGREDITFE